MERKFAKIEAQGERWGVFARITVDDPWVQVESIRGDVGLAHDFANELEDDIQMRREYVTEVGSL